MGRRTLLLIASILIAAVGTGLIGLYVRGADSRAQEGTKQVSALFATQDIPIDTPADEVKAGGRYLEVRTVAAAALPPGPIGPNFAGISGQTRVKILKGAPLQTSMFGSASSSSDSLGVTPGRVAAAFEFTDPNRVAGMLQPGLLVSVYWTPSDGSKDATRLISAVRVLRIGTQAPASEDTEGLSPTSANTDQVPRTILTLDLKNDQVQTLLTDQRDGTLSLGLRPDANKNDPT